jgi:hypothetical protein
MKSLALLALVLAGCSLWAQDYPRLELSAGYSYGSVDTQGYGTQRSAQGFSGSFAANLRRWVGAEVEASSRFQNFDFSFQGTPLVVQSRYYTFLAGPRFAHRAGKATPFVHGLFGVNRSLDYANTVFDPATGTSVTPYTNGMAGVAGGGFDYALSRHLAFRSQADYFFTRQASIYSPTPNNFRVMAAIVFTFGQSESPVARQHSEAPAASAAIPAVQATYTAVHPPSTEAPAEINQIALPMMTAPIPTLQQQTELSIASARSNQLIAHIPQFENRLTNSVMGAQIAPVQLPAAANSHTVILSQVSPEGSQAKPEESLGEIARRYRQSKSRGSQNQNASGI